MPPSKSKPNKSRVPYAERRLLKSRIVIRIAIVMIIFLFFQGSCFHSKRVIYMEKCLLLASFKVVRDERTMFY